MNIYQSNSYRKDLSWLYFEDERRVCKATNTCGKRRYILPFFKEGQCMDIVFLYCHNKAFFTLRRFFYLSFLPAVFKVSWSRQFNLKVSPGPAICLNQNNPEMGYSGRFCLRVTAGLFA